MPTPRQERDRDGEPPPTTASPAGPNAKRTCRSSCSGPRLAAGARAAAGVDHPQASGFLYEANDLRFNLRNSLWPLGELTRLVEHLREAEALARSLGEYRPGIIVLRSNIQDLVEERASQRFGQTGLPSVLSRAWFIRCCVELGEFDQARLRAREAMTITETAAHPFDVVVASCGLGILALREGYLD